MGGDGDRRSVLLERSFSEGPLVVGRQEYSTVVFNSGLQCVSGGIVQATGDGRLGAGFMMEVDLHGHVGGVPDGWIDRSRAPEMFEAVPGSYRNEKEVGLKNFLQPSMTSSTASRVVGDSEQSGDVCMEVGEAVHGSFSDVKEVVLRKNLLPAPLKQGNGQVGNRLLQTSVMDCGLDSVDPSLLRTDATQLQVRRGALDDEVSTGIISSVCTQGACVFADVKSSSSSAVGISWDAAASPPTPVRNAWSRRLGEEVCCSAGGGDDTMIDGELQVGGANGKQGGLLYSAGHSVDGLKAPVGDFLGKAHVSVDGLGLNSSTPQGSCVNDAVNAKPLSPISPGGIRPSNPWKSKLLAWKKPRVVSLPSLSQLGQFSSDGMTAVLDEGAVDDTLKRFEFAIVGRMFGKRIPYAKLAGELARRWEMFGKFRIVTLCGDCFVCFFNDAEARDSVLMGGPWVLFGQILGVDRWTATFSPTSLDGFCTHVWIRMPGLPLYCWSSMNIARVAALVGEPMWIDSATDQIDRGMFARACVRIDLSKPLKPGVWIQGRHGKFFQSLEYEGLSVFCFRCCQVGHKVNTCKLPASPVVTSTIPPPSSCYSDKLSSPPSGTVDCPALVREGSVSGHTAPILADHIIKASDADFQLEDRGAGPWMIVHRKKKAPLAKPRRISREPLSGTEVSLPCRGRSPLRHHDMQVAPLDVSSPPRGSSGIAVELISGGLFKPMFSGFSAVAIGATSRSPRTNKAQLSRSSRSFKEKMLSELGPVAHGSRKRRKAHFITDDKDASSFRPP